MKSRKQLRQEVALAWCTENTKHKKMDVDLAEAFVDILVKEDKRITRIIIELGLRVAYCDKCPECYNELKKNINKRKVLNNGLY